jgi:hypothetical protein
MNATLTRRDAVRAGAGAFLGLLPGCESPTEIVRVCADIGEITAGMLRNAGSTFIINLDAVDDEPMITAPGLEVLANGNATFDGIVAATQFTGATMRCAGPVIYESIEGDAEIEGTSFTPPTPPGGAPASAHPAILISPALKVNGPSTLSQIEVTGSAHANHLVHGAVSGTSAYLGFYGATAVNRPTVSGSKGGNAALGSLVTALATLGLIGDSTS